MGFSVKIESNINIAEDLAKVNDDRFWKFATNEWWRLISVYTPKETGNLINNVAMRPKEIEYVSPYAHYLYEGKVMGPNFPVTENGSVVGFFSSEDKKRYTGKEIKFHNKNQLSSKEWDKAAMPVQEPKLIQALQDYVDAGGLNLSE